MAWRIKDHPNCFPGECGPACQVVDCGIRQGYQEPELEEVPDEEEVQETKTKRKVNRKKKPTAKS